MIIDSHCHSWKYWPYQQKNNHEPNQMPVPNPETWGNIDQLKYEMKINKIDYATIVSAQIWNNTDNNEYVNESIKHQKKLFQFIDFDSYWSDTYQTNGALDRLEKIKMSKNVIGITQYLGEDDGKWLVSTEGRKLFQAINEKKMIVSISCNPRHIKNIRKLAEIFPKMPILLHHMGGMKSGSMNKVENNEVKSVTFVTNAGYAEVVLNNNTNSSKLRFRYSDIRDVKEQIRLKNSENYQIIIQIGGL